MSKPFSYTSFNWFGLCLGVILLLGWTACGTNEDLKPSDEIIYQKYFGGANDEFAQDLIELQDGGHLLLSNEENTDGFAPSFVLNQTQSNGNLKQKILQDFSDTLTFTGLTLANLNDGGFLVGGTISFENEFSYAHIKRYSSEGVIQWEKTFSDQIAQAYQIGDLFELSDGKIAVMANLYQNNGDLRLYLLDGQGNELWAKDYGGTQQEVGKGLLPSNDGGYYLFGHSNSFGDGSQDLFLARADANGNELWFRTYPNTLISPANANEIGTGIASTQDGLVLSGYSQNGKVTRDSVSYYILKTDWDGALLWDYSGINQKHWNGIDSVVVGTRAFSISALPGGGALVTGDFIIDKSNKDQMVLALDGSGEESWMQVYGASEANETGKAIIVNADGGWTILANHEFKSAPGIFLMKIHP